MSHKQCSSIDYGDRQMEKTQEILKHLFDLYHEKVWDEKDIINWCHKNPKRYDAYQKAFKNIEQEVATHAIDNYWRYQSNKSMPTIAKLLAIIFKDGKKDQKQEAKRYYNLASDYMTRDIALNRCKHLIGDYNRAVNYIIEDLLSKEMPISEWVKLDYSQKIEQAQKKELFNHFDEILEMLCSLPKKV